MALSAGRAVIADRRVPDLAGRSGGAVVEIAVDEERTADPGAHGDEQEMTRAAPGAGLQLRVSGSRGVVADHDGTAHSLREHRRGGNLVPAGHVRGVVDDARARVERTGDADGEPADVRAAGRLTGTLRDRIEHRRGPLL